MLFFLKKWDEDWVCFVFLLLWKFYEKLQDVFMQIRFSSVRLKEKTCSTV